MFQTEFLIIRKTNGKIAYKEWKGRSDDRKSQIYQDMCLLLIPWKTIALIPSRNVVPWNHLHLHDGCGRKQDLLANNTHSYTRLVALIISTVLRLLSWPLAYLTGGAGERGETIYPSKQITEQEQDVQTCKKYCYLCWLLRFLGGRVDLVSK